MSNLIAIFKGDSVFPNNYLNFTIDKEYEYLECKDGSNDIYIFDDLGLIKRVMNIGFEFKEKSNEKINILIEVSGGLVQCVTSNKKIDAYVFDFDTDGADPKELAYKDGIEFYLHVPGVNQEDITKDIELFNRELIRLGY